MIFYATPVSVYSAKTRIVLLAKGLSFEEREPPGGYRSAAYRRIVPMGTIPALVDGSLVLSESEVINEYLEEKQPTPPLLPTGIAERARARFLARFHDLHLEPVVRGLFPHIRVDRGDAAGLAERARAFDDRLAQLDAFVTPEPYLAGSALTLADCGHAVTVPLGAMLLAALDRPVALPPALEAWLAVVHGHPAVAAALAPWRAATVEWIRTRLAG